MKKVFVTGANGLLGTNLIIQLLEENYRVKALVRNTSNFKLISNEKVQVIEGNLGNLKVLNEQINDCEFVVHIAANTNQNLLLLENYYEDNVKGTRNIIAACKTNPVKKLVYIGTANTFGYGDLTKPGDERKPMRSPFTKSYYAQSKQQAQELVDSESYAVNVTSICPTFMIGAHDTKPSSGKIIVMFMNKKMFFYPSGGKNFIHEKDVVQGIIRAMNLPESGGKYILSHENLSYHQFFRKVAALNHQKTCFIPIPNFLLYFLGLIGDGIRFMGIKTSLSSVNTKILTIKNYYSNQKAKTELGISFTPIDNAIIDAINYFNKK